MSGEPYRIPIVDEHGNIVGYGDRWITHTVHEVGGELILGQRHIGICIACQNGFGEILIQHRKHVIFDKIWSLSADTHPRKYDDNRVETLAEAATRCIQEDFGIAVTQWTEVLTLCYSARDPHNPKCCENELLHLLVGKYDGSVNPNEDNVYDYRWVEQQRISEEVLRDSRREPINRVYAPWIHVIFEELRKTGRTL